MARRGAGRGLWRAAAAGLALALAAPTFAADGTPPPANAQAAGGASADAATPAAARRVQSVIDAIRAGDLDGAVARLGVGPETDALAARPDLVHVLCDRAVRHDRASSPSTARRALAAQLHALATAALAASPTDDRARWAMAEALVLRERAGPSSGAGAWSEAADHLERIHRRAPSDALPLAYAVGFLVEGATAVPEAAVPLCARSDALARTALAAQKDSPTLAITIATAQSWAARALLTLHRKSSRGQIRAAFESLESFALREPRVLEAATLWNDLVAWERSNGFVMPEKFAVAARTTLDGALALDVPVSSRWSFDSVAATDDASAYDYVTETAADGSRVRQVLFRRYQWNQRYTFQDRNAVGGDNVKSLAQGLQEMTAARVFAPGAEAPAPARRPFNKSMDGFVFEVSGRAAAESDGAKAGPDLRVTGYVMRGHEQACYAVLVYAYGVADTVTPEVESLIASLREPDR